MNPVRTFAATTILESFLFTGTAAGLIPDRALRLSARLRLNRTLSRALAKVIRLKIETPTYPATRTGPRTHAGKLILANHTSILDAIALAALEDAIFVTSKDITESFLVRWLATIGGATFIERRHRENRDQELAELEARLHEGRTVVLFPEATSTDGSEILRFRNGLLQAAFRVSGAEIVPVCLQYLSIGGKPVDASNRHRVFLYGEMSVGTHLRRIFSNPEVRLEAQYFAPIRARDFNNAADLAAHAEFLVRSVYRPTT
jgi:1-acyl-sn-glycerol-3-phosphate acyltransferase